MNNPSPARPLLGLPSPPGSEASGARRTLILAKGSPEAVALLLEGGPPPGYVCAETHTQPRAGGRTGGEGGWGEGEDSDTQTERQGLPPGRVC